MSIRTSVNIRYLLRGQPIASRTKARRVVPHGSARFLSNYDTVSPSVDSGPGLTRAALTRTPSSSFCCVAINELGGVSRVGRVTLTLPQSTAYIMLRATVKRPHTVGQCTSFALTAMKGLSSLPVVVKMLR